MGGSRGTPRRGAREERREMRRRTAGGPVGGERRVIGRPRERERPAGRCQAGHGAAPRHPHRAAAAHSVASRRAADRPARSARSAGATPASRLATQRRRIRVCGLLGRAEIGVPAVGPRAADRRRPPRCASSRSPSRDRASARTGFVRRAARCRSRAIRASAAARLPPASSPATKTDERRLAHSAQQRRRAARTSNIARARPETGASGASG